MKKTLIIGIIFVTVCLGLTIYNEFIDERININIITSKGLKEENKKVYLEATFVAGTITNDNDKAYYVMFGDGVQYIVYMDNDKAKKINNYLLDNPESSYKIEGITKLIPNDLEENGVKFIKEWLDKNHNHDSEDDSHDHNITVDDFYHYFGHVYLEYTNNLDLIKIFIYVTGIFGILFILNYINTKYHLL